MKHFEYVILLLVAIQATSFARYLLIDVQSEGDGNFHYSKPLKKHGEACGKNFCHPNFPNLGDCVTGLKCQKIDYSCGPGSCVKPLKKHGEACGKNFCHPNDPNLGDCVTGLNCQKIDYSCGPGSCVKPLKKHWEACGKNFCHPNEPNLGDCVTGLKCQKRYKTCGHGSCMKPIEIAPLFSSDNGTEERTITKPKLLKDEEPEYLYYKERGCDGRNEIFAGSVSSRDECRSKCNDDINCISFEWWGESNPHYLGIYCQLSNSCTYELSIETGIGSATPDKSDLYVKACPFGFQALEGDVIGNGLESYDASLAKCAEDCKARKDCNAFEHSRVRQNCKLLAEKVPSEPKYEDFQFCTKSATEGTTDCTGYSVDKCTLEDNSLIETLKDVSEEKCQYHCAVTYAPDCKFYIMDNKQVICQLLKSEMSNYVSSCKKYAGPPEPTVAKCFSSNDDCKYYLDGFCRYLGDLLEHLENISSVGTCQMACQNYPGCKYFRYDKETRDCEFRNSNERTCDTSRGPPQQSYDECFPTY